ncbi:UDP-N-acetylmuramoyl-L-alanyl-D-glutamate--2,6-diaminopimelate ligase [Alloacidobacterium dinghuense]|uniref:UDP-N-acetylmuramoyl-L-alanyl-D-glutamate--2,6-diaminopimelate ligase n=1 Tax=Alloacidobacterium dinghuense TaxID=2763107 RepID=A0A7G8BJA6_9BACT|nr:UDP-N-acetylmuramoyl-L-alanyl-D-glutamate--2,6-diaminopimelate ligase [Alloacidobacterium dinghuense]QNI32626.1 UDP-N-acetylmuramoyl-L-alanyl-D-glutamate--2,6-diaminopimelate ligase [Alloacidobacterium dinghuense]
MHIEEVLQGVGQVRRSGPSVDVTSIEYDSRRVGPGSLFVAMQGGTTDGNRYISTAIERGASAVVTDSAMAFQDAAVKHAHIAIAEVAHGRSALAPLAANFYQHPEAHLALSGVTGTNGKTTTAFLLDAMLNSVARTTVLVGTIEYHVAGEMVESPHTTPESRDLLELFARGVSAGATEAVMEVSSHALEQGRVWSLLFDVGVFTNLTRDHLDYHRTMDAYFAAKSMLFDGSNGVAPRISVINVDDAYGVQLAIMARDAGSEILSYGWGAGDFHAEDVQMSAAGMRFRLVTPNGSVSMQTRLSGKVNVYNLLAASAAAYARGLTLDEIAAGAASLACVPGRFQTVDAGQPFTVVVDYAHTDDALRNLIALAREFVKPGNGRVITLFGCGGDRDRTKRPLMGRAAGEGSDFVVLTSDNPRSEEPEAILRDVLPGLEATGVEFIAEPDRAKAIQIAVEQAKPADIVLIAGKGHEKTQTLRERVISFDDVEVAATAIQSLAPTGAKH